MRFLFTHMYTNIAECPPGVHTFHVKASSRLINLLLYKKWNVLNLSPRSHIGANEFKEVNWLPINYRVFQIIVNHLFRILNGKSPIYLQEGLSKPSRIHTHSTRSGTLALFKPRMGSHGQKTFLSKGISLWNSLPTSVQSQQCKDIF